MNGELRLLLTIAALSCHGAVAALRMPGTAGGVLA
jgi:hypothetical protein